MKDSYKIGNRDELIKKLMESFDGSKSQESRHNGAPSEGEAIASQYLRGLAEGSKRAADESRYIIFHG